MQYANSQSRSQAAGITLIELMVALAIGSFLMIGATTVFVQSRSTFRVNESIARLQENARYVFDVIEPDIRMAQFWGLRTNPFTIENRARPDEPVSPLSPVNDCGDNWTVNLEAAVEGSNNAYGFGCGAYGAAAGGADTLVIRRASTSAVDTPVAGALYLQTTRAAKSTLFEGPMLPAGPASGEFEIRELNVNGYYVSRNSSLDTATDTVPSLRRKFLRSGVTGPTIADEEILPGVEDMQVRFGIDTDPAGSPDRGTVNRYVDPNDLAFDEDSAGFDPNARVLAVRIWLRLRSERREPGLPAGPALAYADQDLPPFDDDYRRLIVTNTIFLRNAR